jgi:hypothetical protein
MQPSQGVLPGLPGILIDISDGMVLNGLPCSGNESVKLPSLYVILVSKVSATGQENGRMIGGPLVKIARELTGVPDGKFAICVVIA